MKKSMLVIFCALLLSSCAHNGFLASVETVGRTVIAIPADMAQAAWAALINRVRKGDEGIPKWREEMPDCQDCGALNQDPELDQEKYFYVCDQCARHIRDKSPELSQGMSTYEVQTSDGDVTLRPLAYIQAVPTSFFPAEESRLRLEGEAENLEDVNAKAKRLGLSLSLEEIGEDFYQLPDFSDEKEGEQELQPLENPMTEKKEIWSLRSKLQKILGIKN